MTSSRGNKLTLVSLSRQRSVTQHLQLTLTGGYNVRGKSYKTFQNWELMKRRDSENRSGLFYALSPSEDKRENMETLGLGRYVRANLGYLSNNT